MKGSNPTSFLALLDFEYLALTQVYTFCWWRLYLSIFYFWCNTRLEWLSQEVNDHIMVRYSPIRLMPQAVSCAVKTSLKKGVFTITKCSNK